MSKEYDVRLRRYTPGGGAGPILPALTIDWTAPRSDVPTLKFTASDAITGTLPDLVELAVELWDGSTWREPRNGRFFCLTRSGDGLDQTGAVDYTCVAFSSYMLSKALIETPDGKPLPSSENVGKTIGGVFTAAQERGWGASLSMSFTSSADSAGAPWDLKNNGLAGLEFPAGDTLKAMLQTLADQNSLEYSLTGRTLDIYNAGTGDDLSAGTGRVTVGEAAKELPVTTTLADLGTHVTIRGEAGARWTYPIPGAVETLGRLEMSIAAGGVTTDAQAHRVAELYEVTGRGPRHQYTVTEPAAAMTARPFVEYKNGDWVAARRPTGWERMRVVQVQLRRDAKGAIEVDVILEDIMEDMATRIAKRNSGRVGGSGSAPADASSTSGLGGGTGSGKRGTLATPWGDDGAARVIFEGQTEPDGKRYRYLDNYSPVSADPVVLSPFGDDGELIIMGRVRGRYLDNDGLFDGKFLHRSLADRADWDSNSVLDFTNVLPDDSGPQDQGLSLDPLGVATVVETGTWDIEYKLTLDQYVPGPATDGWANPWLALYLGVQTLGDTEQYGTEQYRGPTYTGLNTAQTMTVTENFAGPVVLHIKDRRTFTMAGTKFAPQLGRNHTYGPTANVNQDASFMKITRVA
jgi:hypothetical protein